MKLCAFTDRIICLFATIVIIFCLMFAAAPRALAEGPAVSEGNVALSAGDTFQYKGVRISKGDVLDSVYGALSKMRLRYSDIKLGELHYFFISFPVEDPQLPGVSEIKIVLANEVVRDIVITEAGTP